MNYNYDKYYQKEKYFGEPYKELISFFRDYHPKGRLLDLGCGQGRDSIPMAELGYEVTGVDTSQVGIRQMLDLSKEKGLSLKGQVADIYEYRISDDFDIILLDSMIHFYKNDIDHESQFIRKILDELRINGLFCNCMIKGVKRERQLKRIIDENKHGFRTLFEEYADYPDYNSIYHILIVEKIGEYK